MPSPRPLCRGGSEHWGEQSLCHVAPFLRTWPHMGALLSPTPSVEWEQFFPDTQDTPQPEPVRQASLALGLWGLVAQAPFLCISAPPEQPSRGWGGEQGCLEGTGERSA